MSPQATNTKSSIAWVIVLTAGGSFMAALDTLIISTGLPTIRLDLGAPVSQLEWTVNECPACTHADARARNGFRRHEVSAPIVEEQHCRRPLLLVVHGGRVAGAG